MATIPSRIANDPRIQMPNTFSKASQARLEQARAIAQTSKAIIGEQYRDVLLSAVVGDSPLQSRAPFDPEHDDDDRALVESITSDGQRVPVLLVEMPERTPLAYTILDGHRRIATLRQLNRESVKAIIVRHDSLECDLITLTANVRKHLTPLEQARVIARLRERHSLTLDEIAKKVGLSSRYITELKGLLETDHAIQAALEKGDIKAKTALALGQAPRALQPTLAELAAGEKVSEADAKRWVGRITDTGETPHQAALALGIATVPPSQAEPAIERDGISASDGESEATTGFESSTARPANIETTLTITAVQGLLTDTFSEMDTQAVQTLTEKAIERLVNTHTVKVAGMLVLSGHDAGNALDAALSILNTQSVRKIIHILDTVADLRHLAKHGRAAPECAPMLATLSRQMLALKQVVASSHRAGKKKRAKVKKGN